MRVQPTQCFNAKVTQLAAAATTIKLADKDPDRLGLSVYVFTADMYIGYSTPVSGTNAALLIKAGGYFEVPFGYIGEVYALSVAASIAQVTEYL